MTLQDGSSLHGTCQLLRDAAVFLFVFILRGEAGGLLRVRLSVMGAFFLDLHSPDNSEERNMIPHQLRIRHYFSLLPLPKPCLSPRYV